MKFLKIRQNYTDGILANKLTRDKSPQSSSRVNNQSHEAIHITENENIKMRFQRKRHNTCFDYILLLYIYLSIYNHRCKLNKNSIICHFTKEKKKY